MKNKKVIILGGGTGLSTLLRGIKYIDHIDISAIVSVSDDGGSTGTLREKFTIPAVGDLRRVMGSLSRDRKELSQLLEYRFLNTNTDLDGHSIGNLIIVSQILNSNSFAIGISNACKMLNIEGSIIPVSNNPDILVAKFVDGSIVEGESKIHKKNSVIKEVFFKSKKCQATQIAIDSIEKADYIILGIGSLYTSLIPNLIYPNMRKALKKSKAKVIYFANLFTEPGETTDMSIMDHVRAIEHHTHHGFVNEVIVNSSKMPSSVVRKYEQEGQFICKDDVKGIHKIKVPLLNSKNKKFARHDEEKVEALFRSIIK